MPTFSLPPSLIPHIVHNCIYCFLQTGWNLKWVGSRAQSIQTFMRKEIFNIMWRCKELRVLIPPPILWHPMIIFRSVIVTLFQSPTLYSLYFWLHCLLECSALGKSKNNHSLFTLIVYEAAQIQITKSNLQICTVQCQFTYHDQRLCKVNT